MSSMAMVFCFVMLVIRTSLREIAICVWSFTVLVTSTSAGISSNNRRSFQRWSFASYRSRLDSLPILPNYLYYAVVAC